MPVDRKEQINVDKVGPRIFTSVSLYRDNSKEQVRLRALGRGGVFAACRKTFPTAGGDARLTQGAETPLLLSA